MINHDRGTTTSKGTNRRKRERTFLSSAVVETATVLEAVPMVAEGLSWGGLGRARVGGANARVRNGRS